MPPKKGSKKKTTKAAAKVPTPEPEQTPVEQDVQMEPPVEAEPQTEPKPTTMAESAEQVVKDVAEAAREFVESMDGEISSKEESGAKLTMEERKAKMEQLRAKMVRLFGFSPQKPSH